MHKISSQSDQPLKSYRVNGRPDILTDSRVYSLFEYTKRDSIDKWYKQYIRFVVALNKRVAVWKETEKYRPTLPNSIIEKTKRNEENKK